MEYFLKCLCSIMSTQTIMFIRMLTGCYYNVSSHRSMRLCARAYCVIFVLLVFNVALLLLKSYLSRDEYVKFAKTLLLVVLFLLNVIINFICDGEYFFRFRDKITKVDFLLTSKLPEDNVLSKLLFTGLLLTKKLSTIAFCVKYNPMCIYSARIVSGTTLIQTAAVLSNITRIMMFESVYHRMKLLRKRFERDLSVSRRFEDGEEIMTENLRKCMNIYKSLLNTVRVSHRPMKILMFFTTATVIPNSVILAYEVIQTTAFKYSFIDAIEMIMQMMMPFIPGIFVELVNSEIDKIRIQVVRQLLVYRGAAARAAIVNVVKYIEQRPFNYTIARVLTVDLTLLLTTVGLITTYIIAMIQFTHIYD